MTAKGVTFVRPPAIQPYGKVAVFLDLYGNKWDLVRFSPPITHQDDGPGPDAGS